MINYDSIFQQKTQYTFCEDRDEKIELFFERGYIDFVAS